MAKTFTVKAHMVKAYTKTLRSGQSTSLSKKLGQSDRASPSLERVKKHNEMFKRLNQIIVKNSRSK
jgi:hypothetical protein